MLLLHTIFTKIQCLVAMAQLVEAMDYKLEGHGSITKGVNGIFVDLVLLPALWPWGRISLLTEMSTGSICWGVKVTSA